MDEITSTILHGAQVFRNARGATGAGFLFVLKACQQAHSRLRNSWPNTEDGQKDKLVVLVICCMFLNHHFEKQTKGLHLNELKLAYSLTDKYGTYVISSSL